MAVKQYTALTSGTISIPVDYATSYPDFVYVENIIVGTVTLVGPLAISPSGTPTTGQKVLVTWNASVTTTGVPITIFGETVPDELAAKNFIAECIYDGAAWVVNILPDFAGTGIVDSDRLATDSVSTAKIQDDAVTLAKLEAAGIGKIIYGDGSGNPKYLTIQDAEFIIGDTTLGATAQTISGDAAISKTGALTIANSAVTTAKIDDGAVTPTKLSASARKSMVAIPVSFETTGEIGVVKYTMCFDCTVDGIEATVTKPAATDTATIIFKDHGGSVLTGSQVDITTSLVLGNIVSTTPTANNTFSAGEQITFETSKTTAGSGNCTVVLCLTHD